MKYLRQLALAAGFLTAFGLGSAEAQKKLDPDIKRLHSDLEKICKQLPKKYKCNAKRFINNSGTYHEAICQSRGRGEYALIVDKAASELELFYKGKKLKTYKVDLGRRAHKQKSRDCDGRVPEGTYRISFWDDALRLDYPNYQDYQRIKKQRSKGRIGREKIEIRSGGRLSLSDSCREGDIVMSSKDLKDLRSRIKPRRKINATIVKYGSRDKY